MFATTFAYKALLWFFSSETRENHNILWFFRLELLTGFVRSAERDGIGELREPSQFRCRVAASKKDISGALACSEMSVNGAANRIRTGDLVLTKDVLYLLSHSSILNFVPI